VKSAVNWNHAGPPALSIEETSGYGRPCTDRAVLLILVGIPILVIIHIASITRQSAPAAAMMWTVVDDGGRGAASPRAQSTPVRPEIKLAPEQCPDID